ncbi:hypothetical protein BHM03_00050451 [Ensete ventricosum]|nr:hypothetical protein BHM03_00050451 [Ensete ventricosum]
MAIIFAPYPSPLPTPCVCVCKFHAHSSFVRLRLQRIHKQSTRKPKHWPRWWVQKQRPSWRSGSCGAHFNDATSTKAQEQKLGVAPYPTVMAQGRGSASDVVALGIALLCLLLLCEIGEAAVYTVGDSKGWTFNTVGWSKGKRFRAGDVLGELSWLIVFLYL